MFLFSIVSEGKIWNLYRDCNNNNVYMYNFFTSESLNGVEVMYYIDNNIPVHPMKYTGTRVIPLNCIVILFLNLRTKYGQILCVYQIIPCANPSLKPQPHITFL